MRVPSALSLFTDFPGWESTPTPARVLAHAKAHPYDRGVDEDCARNYPAGLWVAREGRFTTLVLLEVGDPAETDYLTDEVHGQAVAPVAPVNYTIADDFCIDDEARWRRIQWLPLDAHGRPLSKRDCRPSHRPSSR